MGNSAVDLIALAVGGAVAALITVSLGLALRSGDTRRGWIAAGVLFAALSALGVADLLRHSPRETTFSTVIIGSALPVLGTLGLLRGTRRVRPWIRWTVAGVSAFVLVFAGLLAGAVLARYLPF